MGSRYVSFPRVEGRASRQALKEFRAAQAREMQSEAQSQESHQEVHLDVKA